jgi:hypothetical protein
VVASVRSPNPSDDELRRFFGCDAEWVYIGGHYTAGKLFNQAAHEGRSGALVVNFFTNDVIVSRDGTARFQLVKGDGFLLHKTAWVVLWGGCSVLKPGTVRTMRRLFDQHTMLGFGGSTNWSIVNDLLGGGSVQPDHFFNRVRPRPNNQVLVRDAWMGAAAAKAGPAGGARAVDMDGETWMLSGGKVVPGEIVL